MQNPYAVLGVTPSASDEMVRRAYLRLARIYHPDTTDHKTQREKHFAHVRMQEINAAYDAICTQRAVKKQAQQGQELDKYQEVLAFLRRGESFAALHAMDKIVPRDAQWHAMAAQCYEVRGWPLRAMQHLQAACRLDKDNLQYQKRLENLKRMADEPPVCIQKSKKQSALATFLKRFLQD